MLKLDSWLVGASGFNIFRCFSTFFYLVLPSFISFVLI